jgi:ribonuclease J
MSKEPTVKLLAVGGYGKLVANMTVLVHKKDLYIVDSGKGFEIPQKHRNLTPRSLSTLKPTVPSFDLLDQYLQQGYNLKAIFVTHCHGDHVGGLTELINYLDLHRVERSSYLFYCSNYTFNFISQSIKNMKKENTCILQNLGEYEISDQVKLSTFFLNHSSYHSVALNFEFEDAKILYLPDHKIDYITDIGVCQKAINNLLQKLNDRKLDLVVLEGTSLEKKAEDQLIKSESLVAIALRQLIAQLDQEKNTKTILVSTYGSNAERIIGVLECARDTKRTIFPIGRGIKNALEAIRKTPDLVKVLESKKLDLSKLIEKNTQISQVNKNKNKYLVLTTGHMGQYNAGLSKMIRGEIMYHWSDKDVVIISSKTIPKEGPIVSRAFLRSGLLSKRVKVYDADKWQTLHTSGHITQKDYIKYMQTFNKAKNIVLNHGDLSSSLLIYSILQKANLEHKNTISDDKVKVLKDGQIHEVY